MVILSDATINPPGAHLTLRLGSGYLIRRQSH
jgi:hypothetical protein